MRRTTVIQGGNDPYAIQLLRERPLLQQTFLLRQRVLCSWPHGPPRPQRSAWPYRACRSYGPHWACRACWSHRAHGTCRCSRCCGRHGCARACRACWSHRAHGACRRSRCCGRHGCARACRARWSHWAYGACRSRHPGGGSSQRHPEHLADPVQRPSDKYAGCRSAGTLTYKSVWGGA